MLYLGFWNTYLKNLAEDSAGTPDSPEEPTRIFHQPPIDDDREAVEQIFTLLKEAEQRQEALSAKEKYEYLTEYGTQILCLLDAREGCSYLSRNFETITGIAADDCMQSQFFHIVHSDYQARLQELLLAQSPGNKPHQFRCRLKHADGSWQWYVFLIHSKWQEGRLQQVCVFENINDMIAAQNTLQKAKLEAELALRARSEFLANMSHDLRTPLNAVIGFAQLIDSQMHGKIESKHYLDYVKHIQEGGYDLLSKIEDLLEISSIDAGRVELDKSETYLEDMIEHVIHAQNHHAQSAGVTLAYSLPQDETLLYVDRLKLQHIFGHLIANAIRHSPKGGQVRIEAGIDIDSKLILRVRDDGVGIDRLKLAGINAALKEENCWSAKNNQSIGLGLALAKEFITLHGGTIKIISKLHTGTTVYLTLPAECLRNDIAEHPRFAHLVES